ncbi:saccharopine dehydrogenase family protein [Chiayiivirga flava]|uniref:Short subunit dehydrogenase-like uncharacterized protein n=1 Tax=Chiayiivirga flava TaxID=659595 RepID=A0A7W8D544_9GAMM|nr:saccharopine dehydrogenase NADP-binding domain-containing protein [Chiayiivirga flava]MBB5208090.1 short subunit dehydrogenase-like uncharacterized protein [Chiayiivirga flava]
MQWMIYGANGYTGRLIALEAKRRGLAPILAARNAQTLADIGNQTGFAQRVFDLSPDALRTGLEGVDLVLHCAGPFSATCAPMLEACLERKTHYLDITGEIDVFAHCHAQHDRARTAGVVVLPGAGFDVVPTDCLAAQLKRDLPGATHLTLAFDAGGGLSPGTAKSSVEGLAKGGRARIDGRLQRVPLAWKTREFVRDGKTRTAMTIPWGDVYTAFVSTGIPNIEVYLSVPPSTVTRMRRLRRISMLLGLGAVQRFLKRRVEKTVRGPSDAKRASTDTFVWGEARDANGTVHKGTLRTPNGYDITVTASLGIVQHLMKTTVPGGYYTPSLLMGPDYVLGLPGVSRE